MSLDIEPTVRVSELRTSRRRFVVQSAAAVVGIGGAVGIAEQILERSETSSLVLGNRLQAGRAWTLTQSVAGSVDYRGPNALKTPTIRLVTQHDGTQARVTLARTEPISLRGKLLRIWLRIDPVRAANLHQVNLLLGSGAATFESYAYQTLVAVDSLASYESEFLKPAEWVALTICPASLALLGAGVINFDAIRDFAFAVGDNGKGPAVALFGGMQVIPASSVFPNGVVSLTFDDGLASPYLNARETLDAHGYRATAYLIHDLIGSDGYLSAAQLTHLQSQGWELAAHASSARIHNAQRGIVRVPADEVVQDWLLEHSWLQGMRARGADDLALPQGLFDRRVVSLLDQYPIFKTVRTTNFRSIETLPVADPHRLRTISYDVTVPIGPASTFGSLKWRIDQVFKYGGWLILTFHDVVQGESSGSTISAPRFKAIVDHIARRKVPVRTIAEVWAAAGGRLDRLPPRATRHT
jgi:peptidoglycan/xylan/chitin deacetylase (PgdA/CDA1 family)